MQLPPSRIYSKEPGRGNPSIRRVVQRLRAERRSPAMQSLPDSELYWQSGELYYIFAVLPSEGGFLELLGRKMPVLSSEVVLELERLDTCCRHAVERFLLVHTTKRSR